MEIYYNYLLTPSKKQKVSYNIFKKDYLHLNFDENKEVDPVIDDETFAKMQSYFKKPEPKKEEGPQI